MINAAATYPKWLGEIFGCRWNPKAEVNCTPIPGNSGMCQCEYTFKNITGSWLWGACGDIVLINNTACEWYPHQALFEELVDKFHKKMVADYYADRIGVDSEVDSLWTDSTNFNDSTTFFNAIKYRVELAGYVWDDNWMTLSNDPCPVPIPTETVIDAQHHVYYNSDCGTNLIVYPNPNNGVFTIDLENLGELVVSKLEIIKASDFSVVYSNNSINLHYEVTLTVTLPEDNGTYYILAYTANGILTKSIIIE